MKVTVIPIVICTLNTIPKWVIKVLNDWKIRGQVETIQASRLAEKEFSGLEDNCCHSISSEKL